LAALALVVAPWSVLAAGVVALPALDHVGLRIDDQASTPGTPLRYGLVQQVHGGGLVNGVASLGTLSELPDGRVRWDLELRSEGAFSLEPGFSRFRLPAGAVMVLRSGDGGSKRGPYTDADNPSDGGPLRLPFVQGDRVVITLDVARERLPFVQLALDNVTAAYRDIFNPWSVEKSGSCNVDTICVQPATGDWTTAPWAAPVKDRWSGFRADAQISSVAMYTYITSSGSGSACTGQAIRQVGDPGTWAFLTAHHCLSTEAEARSMTLYWKYETSACRIPGSSDSGSPISRSGNSIAQAGGAVLLASYAPSDVTLVRLRQSPPSSASVIRTGWFRGSSAPEATFGIHHPASHEKRISFDNDPSTVGRFSNLGRGSGRTHWIVEDWDLGTTEQGSSGSGLWDRDGLLIGQLHGGAAACGNDSYDAYGRLFNSWNGGGAPWARVRDHLDPAGSNAQLLGDITMCEAPSVSLSSTAFSSIPRAGDVLTFNVAVSGGSGAPYTIDWNIDPGTGIDRSGSGTSLSVRYPSAISTQIGVTVRDSAGCAASASRALDVVAPDIAFTSAGSAAQICGNGNAIVNPGERWRIPVTLRNNGGAALGAGARALFAQGDASGAALPLGPDSFGHRGTTTAQGGCGYTWIDIVSGANAVPALTLSDSDDGRAVVSLQGGGFSLYGQQVSQMVMSTNGYLALNTADDGGDWFASCSSYDGVGPRLQVLHDDHVVGTGGGLRYRYFASCPRAPEVGATSQACHVFTWTGLRPFGATGNAEFQAVLYPATRQASYQYRTADANNAGQAVIGIGNADFSDFLQVSCSQTNAVTPGSAVCLFSPGSIPGSQNTPIRIETPTLTLPTLAVGASTTVNVDVAVPSNATCGAQFAVDYIASADATSFSKRSQTVFTGTVGGDSCAVVDSCPAQIPARTERQGLYYNTRRGGNGVSALLYGAAGGPRLLGGAWFTGDANRRPTWYLLQGPYQDNLGQADILRFTNSAAPGGFQVGPPSVVGKAWVSFTSNDRVMMAWELNNGRAGAELMETLPVAPVNRSQAYYNPSQSGWGQVVDTASLPGGGFQEFTVNYIYDAQGQPVWTLGALANPPDTATTFGQSAWRVHCPACPQLTDWGAAPFTLNAGNVIRSWGAPGSGTVSTSILMPAPLSGSWNRTNLPVQALGPIQ
jgi:lysyl endopeptidase